MSKSKFKKQEVVVDCGGLQPELFLVHPLVEEDEKTLTPADYDRWERFGFRVTKRPSEE